jgi:hypothetical protein
MWRGFCIVGAEHEEDDVLVVDAQVGVGAVALAGAGDGDVVAWGVFDHAN